MISYAAVLPLHGRAVRGALRRPYMLEAPACEARRGVFACALTARQTNGGETVTRHKPIYYCIYESVSIVSRI